MHSPEFLGPPAAALESQADPKAIRSLPPLPGHTAHVPDGAHCERFLKEAQATANQWREALSFVTPRTTVPTFLGSPNHSDSATHGAVPAFWETLLTSDLKRPQLHRSGTRVPSVQAISVGSSVKLRTHPVVPDRSMQNLSGAGTSPRQFRPPQPARQRSSACNAGRLLTSQAVKAQLCNPESGLSLRSIDLEGCRFPAQRNSLRQDSFGMPTCLLRRRMAALGWCLARGFKQIFLFAPYFWGGIMRVRRSGERSEAGFRAVCSLTDSYLRSSQEQVLSPLYAVARAHSL